MKSRDGKSQRREEKRRAEKRREEERRSKRKSLRRKKIQAREQVGKSRNTVFFQWFVAPKGGSEGSKSRLAKAAGAEPCGQMRDEKLHALWREAHFQVKMYKAPYLQSTFRSWDVEKVHAVVARSTFRSQNAQSISCSDHFWKLRCRNSARCCGAKHISKSKSTTRHMYVPLLDVEASFCVADTRDCGPCQKWAKFEGFVAFQKQWQAWDIWRGSAKMHFPWEAQCKELLGGQGADFLTGFAFWSIRSVGLLRWFCVTGAALRMTWHHFFVAGAVL